MVALLYFVVLVVMVTVINGYHLHRSSFVRSTQLNAKKTNKKKSNSSIETNPDSTISNNNNNNDNNNENIEENISNSLFDNKYRDETLNTASRNSLDNDLSNLNQQQSQLIPPEIVFFGEPRQPPPVEAYRDPKYHGSLLMWARHATVAPRSSQERIDRVFPKGKYSAYSSKYRLDNINLTFDKIFNEFINVMDDIEQSKQFIEANIDIISPKMFMRAITAQKLSAQSKKNINEMKRLKTIREKYIVANDQLFFPLNLEVSKAETRVMTYLSRNELRKYAAEWDEIEASLHFTTLLAARLIWDERVKEALDNIKRRLDDSVEYMAARLKDDLMNREFRKPGLTSEVYRNASLSIQFDMPELYSKIKPEIKILHETYFMEDLSSEEIKNFIVKDFGPKNDITIGVLKEKLKILDSTLAAIEDMDYIRLRLRAQKLYMMLCDSNELEQMDKWYKDFVNKGYDFETYEPDEVPTLIAAEQRIRETGNAFVDFAVQVMKMPTKYTEAFSGKRKKGREVDNWLDLDTDISHTGPESLVDKMQEFRKAYMKQSELRKEAEMKLTRMVINRMDSQDNFFSGKFEQQIMELNDEEYN
jgi:hypothetical protein